MEPTSVMVLFRRRVGGTERDALQALEATRRNCLASGSSAATAFPVDEQTASRFAEDRRHYALWTEWYAEGLYRQWRETFTPRVPLILTDYLEFVALRPEGE